jgi:SAM-dependent methyltransferase
MFDRSFLKCLRRAELEAVLPFLPAGARILEIGAGQGEQARALSQLGFDIIAIDVASSSYADERVHPVADYDERTIPLSDASVDAVFSSNVLEHVEHLPELLHEMHRVTAPSGIGIHVMPTPAWRFWTLLAGPATALAGIAGLIKSEGSRADIKDMAAALLPIGHGTSREAFSELWTFSTIAWKKRFTDNGFDVIATRPIGLFHTGHMLFGRRLSIALRRRLSRRLGSAATIYIVRSVSASSQTPGMETGRRVSQST